MVKYIVLADVTDRVVAGTQGIRLRPAGGASAREVALNEHDLDERDVAEARRNPHVLALGADMPVHLIAPVAAHAHADPGGTLAPTCAATPVWGLNAVNAPAAHAAGLTGTGVCVSVLDTGIDTQHPAFAHVTPTLMDFTGDQARAGSAPDENGHGTHCAGTIFGTHPSQAIAVAPGVTDILIGRVLDAGGHGGSAAVFKALQWAQQQGANVVSMSLGFDFPGFAAELQKDGWPPDLAASTALEAYRQNLRVFDKLMGLFKSLADMQTAPLVVAAAGNESRRGSDPRFRIAASLPSAAEDVISVAALERAADGYAVAGFSNSMATVSGPGVAILSARMGSQGYVPLNGTSMACPHVAGVAALWWQAMVEAGLDPNPTQVARRLLTTCRLSDLGVGARDRVDIGEGLVQAPTAALRA